MTNYMRKPFKRDEESPLNSEQLPLNRGDTFIQGIRKLNEIAKKEYEEPFVDLEEEQQIELLKRFEADEITFSLMLSSEFFELLRSSTIKGCYADPMYGGNKNLEGWKMKEYPGPRLAHIDIVEEEDFILLEPVSLKNQK